MKPENRILVALDGSPRAPYVLKLAESLRQRGGAPMTALRVIGVPHELPQEMLRLSPTEVEKVLVADARAQLDDMCKRAGVDAVRRVEEGIAWDAICRVAEEEQAQLVVMGSHGYKGLDRVLGTTAGKVVNHAKCSVLIARQPHEEDRPLRRVLVGLDASERAPGVLNAALALAKTAKGEPAAVFAATAVHVPEHVGRIEDSARTLLESLQTVAEEDLDKLVASAPKGAVQEQWVVRGTPWRVLLELSKTHEVDAIVVGTHGYAAIDHLIGTTATR
jgi:nucleotide-binding universal stress UspA family protein